MWSGARSLSRIIPKLSLQESFKSAINQFPSNYALARTVSTSSKLFDRRYSDKHEWIEVQGKIATVGISHYAQEALGDVVYAQLPEVGSTIAKAAECGALESVKAASEIYSPVSGSITEINRAVEETPALVNQSCYDKGWLFKIELSDQSELQQLMTEEEYKEFLTSSQH